MISTQVNISLPLQQTAADNHHNLYDFTEALVSCSWQTRYEKLVVDLSNERIRAVIYDRAAGESVIRGIDAQGNSFTRKWVVLSQPSVRADVSWVLFDFVSAAMLSHYQFCSASSSPALHCVYCESLRSADIEKAGIYVLPCFPP